MAIVDGDMRQGNLHEVFGVKNDKGLTTVIEQRVPVMEAVQSSSLAEIDILTRGPSSANPADSLARAEFANALKTLQYEYDVVLVDSPSLARLSEACDIATVVDGVVLVVRAGKSSSTENVRARRLLAALGVRVLGVVFNGRGAGERVPTSIVWQPPADYASLVGPSVDGNAVTSANERKRIGYIAANR